MRVFVAFLLAACSSPSDVPEVVLPGTFNCPTSTTGHLLVGTLQTNDTSTLLRCDHLGNLFDGGSVSLPSDYEVSLPLGSYLLVGVLITNGATRAPYAMYPVMIDDEGVHVSSPQPIHRLDMLCQGEIEHDCN